MNPTDSPPRLPSPSRLDALDRKLDLAKMEEITLWRAFREPNKLEMRRALGFLARSFATCRASPAWRNPRRPSLSTPN